MRKKVTTYQKLKRLTHKFVDLENNGEYEIVCRKFETLLVELANDMLARPKAYGYSYYTKNNYKRYLRILASNINRWNRLGMLRRFKEFLDSLEIEARLHLLNHLGDFLIIMAYGRNTQFFADLDKNNGKDKKQKDERHYPYIAYNTDKFIQDVLLSTYEKFGRRKSFVDVGCGIGDKVFLAWLSGIFDECIGIEYEGFTSSIAMGIAQEGLSKFRPHLSIENGHICSEKFRKSEEIPIDFGIINADAFDISYRNFDTIYLYHPIADEDLMEKLYEHIFNTMHSKAILLEMMQDNGLQRAVGNINEERFKLPNRLYGSYYYKTTTKKIRHRRF